MKLRFGRNLARCRAGANISQEELSFLASIHRTEVSLLERGERMPRVDTALRLAGSLGVPLDVSSRAWSGDRDMRSSCTAPGRWSSDDQPTRDHNQVSAGPAEIAAANGSP